MSTRITLQRLDSFRLLHISLYKSFRNPSLHLEPRRVRVAVKSRNVKDAQVDDDFGLHIDNDDAVCLRQAARVPDSGLVQFKVDNTLDYHQTNVTSRRSTIARWAMAVIMWVAGEQNCKAKASEKVKYVAQKEGFQFEYPSESFVVAFDRTGGGTKDGALVSVGDFTRYIVVSVFQQQQSQRIPGSLDAESGYALCLDPVIQADSTVGFRVIEALMVQPVGNSPAAAAAAADGSYEDGRNRKGVFAFEYQVSICRGDTILEGKGGALRCQVCVCICTGYSLDYIFHCPCT